jgi:signal transduction histidine kinase
MRRFSGAIITPTLVVFLAVMVVVGISFIMSQNSTQNEIDQTVKLAQSDYETNLQNKLAIFQESLNAGVGFFAAEKAVTQEMWDRYVTTSGVIERFPGAAALAYSKYLLPAERDAFVSNAKAVISPNFAINPVGEREWYTPIMFVAPYNAESTPRVIGYDIGSEERRNRAQVAARDSGQVTLSDVVESTTSSNGSAADNKLFLMYKPQYEVGAKIDTPEQRRAAIDGFLYAAFRVEEFMKTLGQVGEDDSIGVKIQTNEKALFYESSNFSSIEKANHERTTSKINIGATPLSFTYVYKSSDVIPGYVSSRPIAILVFGTIMAILIASAVWLVLRAKADELLLEKERGINEAKDNLLSLASHQLRTPATGVKQYLGLILQGFVGEVSPQQRALLEKANSGNERQLKTINDVLYLARLGSGRIVLTKSQFSIARLLEDIILELDDNIAEKQHKVTLSIPKRQKDFYGDEHMIRMAIENLLTNAIKYTHKKGKINVKLIFGKLELKILVTDNGVGIPTDQQVKMFKQFERIDNELSIAVGGSGIGLYVVQNVAGLHGGHIEVQSATGKGATFTLVLPYAKPPENDKV